MDTAANVQSDEDMEYEEIEEEIEVEEEIEAEEEEEIEEVEEDDDDGEESGENLTPIVQTNAGTNTGQVIEPDNVGERLNPDPATPGKSVVNLPPDSSVIVGKVGLRETWLNEDSELNGKVIDQRMTGETASFSFGAGNAAISDTGGSSKDKDNPYIEKETYRITGEASRVRPRSSTSESELNDGSKRPAAKCIFFAKGWCIKGNSCRFLHVKDQVAVTSHQKEGIDYPEKKNELLVGEATFSSQRIPNCVENHVEKHGTEEFPLLQGDPSVSSQDFRREFNMEDYNGYSSPFAKDGSCRETFSKSCRRLSENYESLRNAPHMMSMEETTCKRSHLLANDHNLPPSISSLHRSPLSFCYPSWNADLFSTHKRPDNGQEYHGSRPASMQQSSSPCSGSESENLSRTNALGDKQCSVGSKAKIPYDWEPSVPFIASYPLTRSLLSSRSLYDPIRDSIEQTKSSLETSALGTRMQANVDTFATRPLGTECSSNKCSLSDSKFHGSSSAKNFPGKDVHGTEEIESLGVQWHDRKALLEEGMKRDSDHVGDVTHDEVVVRCDSKLENGGRCGMQGKEERSRQMMEADADLKVEESRALKNFHASLVEVVKELLKPSWHGGILSKDAHKLIVKKAVEKVLVALPPHHVPSTSESVKLYLSASHAKLAKLVEGYVDKYRKS